LLWVLKSSHAAAVIFSSFLVAFQNFPGRNKPIREEFNFAIRSSQKAKPGLQNDRVFVR
jgi:hypothetical protein